MSKRDGKPDSRFAAKLLFQYRVGTDPLSDRMRTCEERIINFAAGNAKAALAVAKRYGKAARFKYMNDSSEEVHFEFVGVLELLELGIECQPEEVWYDVRKMLTPMERRAVILPAEHELAAFQSRWGAP